MKHHARILLLFVCNTIFAGTLNLSLPAGKYNTPITVSASIDNGILLYSYSNTFNSHSSVFPKKLTLKKTRTISFAQKLGKKIIPLGSYSYFINFPTDFKIVSLSINKNYLYNSTTGIYVNGANSYYTANSKFLKGANFNKRWERKLFLEVFDEAGERIIAQNAGLRIFGGMTRYYPEKSMRLIARKEYGEKKFNADLYNDGINKHKEFVLRHSGNDYLRLRFLDAFATTVAAQAGLDVQRFCPAHLFVNSEYWGVYNIRERISKDYIHEHYNVPKESVDLLQGQGEVKEGSGQKYKELLSYIRHHSLASTTAYNHVKTLMDCDNYANYWIHQIFYVNSDARGNIRWWRSDSLDGKFRWIVYDIDLGFVNGKAKSDYLTDFTSPVKTVWYNPQWATFLLRNVLKNKEFKQYFINQSLYLLSTSLSTPSLTATIDSFQTLYQDEMKIHYAKRKKFQKYQSSYKGWEMYIKDLKNFVKIRPYYYEKYLVKKFHLKNRYTVKITANQVEGSAVIINGNRVKEFPYIGHYYASTRVPVSIDADIGFNITKNKRKVMKKNGLPDSIIIALTFTPKKRSTDDIIINEIDPKTNTIELFNSSNAPINLNNWTMRSKKSNPFPVKSFLPQKILTFPNISLQPHSFLLVSYDNRATKYDSTKVVISPFKVGNKKDTIKMYDSQGALVDSVAYSFDTIPISYARTMPTPSLGDITYQWVDEAATTLGAPNNSYLNILKQQKKNEKVIYYWLLVALGFLCINGIIWWVI